MNITTRSFPALVLWALAPDAPAAPAEGDQLIDVGFESQTPGPYTDDMARKDFGVVPKAGLYDLASIVRDQAPGRGKFSSDAWHQITEHIKVNSADKANGVLEVWFDGRSVLSRSDIRFRIGDQGLIDSLYFSTFHGGNTPEWGPGLDCHAYFDQFVVSRKPLVPDAPAK